MHEKPLSDFAQGFSFAQYGPLSLEGEGKGEGEA